MALERAFETPHFMVNILASGRGSARERVREAWKAHGGDLNAEDLPEPNREDLEFLQAAMSGRWPAEAGPDAEDEGKAKPLTEEQASTVASNIAWLWGEVAYALGRRDERDWPRPDGGQRG